MNQLTTLRAYSRLVELESFTGVAKELRVKQSTVSKWIAALEEDLGVRLVDRTTRSIRITEAGQLFYRRASAIVSDYEDAVGEVREEATALRGRIRMSVPVVFGQRFIVPAITDFLMEHEQIELELIFGDRYVSLVEEGYDLAIRVGIPVDSALRSHWLGDGRRYLVAAPSYVRRYGSPREPRDLENHECLIHTERSTWVAWTFKRGKKSQQVRVSGRVSANHSESTLHMTRAGLGVALLASWFVEPDLKSGRLVALLPDHELPSAPVRALTPPGRLLASRVRSLIEHIRAELGPALASMRVTPNEGRAGDFVHRD
ncbi:MAG TPA: LysR family transcriptional regulator [Nannocystis exedens]|nr:LysR family transcriptional regulator [Nannocystis exedens]